jgi:Rrf2 family transcriptional regulator, nitric oxide-sensitive transcriptional repressor
MRLTAFTDYTLRVLVYLGVHPGRQVTIADISASYGISSNHLMKVVHHLGKRGYIETLRGKGGGMRLARAPGLVNVGELVRGTEEMALVECFDKATSRCAIQGSCRLRGLLDQALEAFFAELDRHTLADLLAPRQQLAKVLLFPPAGPRARMPPLPRAKG